MQDENFKSPVDEIKEGVTNLNSEKKWALSCYIPVANVIFCLIASVRMPKSDFVSFHARQGIVLFGLWFLTIFIALISEVLSLMFWGVTLLLYISGMVIAIRYKSVKIPVIGQIAMMIPRNYFFTKLTGTVDVAESGDQNSKIINK